MKLEYAAVGHNLGTNFSPELSFTSGREHGESRSVHARKLSSSLVAGYRDVCPSKSDE
jgi:hypothetical protein